MENLIINIATVNGTGSLSANQLLTKILFRAGWNIGSYNFFPSNIAGLACLYNLRINSKGYTGFSIPADILISLNPKSFGDDFSDLKPQGLLISDEKDNIEELLLSKEPDSQFSTFTGSHWAIPISQSLKDIQNLSPRKKPLFRNMIYIALLCEWLEVKEEIVKKSIEDFFQESKNSEIIEQNFQAIQIGRNLAKEYSFPFSLKLKSGLSKNKGSSKKTQDDQKDILIDGNTSSALGALSAGCQFLSWYPITPASSLAENFENFANIYQKDNKGRKKFVVLQAEDELACISQVIGAGWAGLRAMTVTSGPGISLMSEGAGLSYFAEIPAVLYNVQRAGPSTGLPTRTQQGDLLSSCFLSHGDSKYIVLLPGNPEEAFTFTQKAFDLAEDFQTLVIVLSDLNLGMNLKRSKVFSMDYQALNRGKLLREKDLENRKFIPYEESENDGRSFRTLPGINHEKGAYLNRGSGHNIRAEYSERPQDYKWKLDKLKRKWQTAKEFMPPPSIDFSPESRIAFVTFGPNEEVLEELRDHLEKKGTKVNFMRICSFPFPFSVEHFLKQHSEIFVVEQNRDAQLRQLLSGEFPEEAGKMKSLLQYDGRPLAFDYIKDQFYSLYLQAGKEIFI